MSRGLPNETRVGVQHLACSLNQWTQSWRSSMVHLSWSEFWHHFQWTGFKNKGYCGNIAKSSLRVQNMGFRNPKNTYLKITKLLFKCLNISDSRNHWFVWLPNPAWFSGATVLNQREKSHPPWFCDVSHFKPFTSSQPPQLCTQAVGHLFSRSIPCVLCHHCVSVCATYNLSLSVMNLRVS